MDKKTYYIATILFLISFSLQAQNFDVTVASDGSGDFTSIQEAINAAPASGTKPFIIFVKNGIYDEKLFIEKNFITIVGEDSAKTIITTSVLRRVWRETNPSDWGVATINIANAVTDLTLANLTIRNNFAELNPTFPNNTDHTMAIRGGGNRIIIINCNVIATGGDTCSLWNTAGGMFYHINCHFSGYVDYVCPRGYCYISNCTFFGYNNNASIWHDGSGGEDHKLVVRYSDFDGITNFALGRYHRDAAFYLLDCNFSKNINNNGGILFVETEALQWGKRVYYYNCHRETGDYPWHFDNLNTAKSNPDPDSINALWTFNKLWNPEALVDGLLPFAVIPKPADKQQNVPLEPTLTWVKARNAVAHLIHIGTDNQPAFAVKTDNAKYTPGRLKEGVKYYWRVDEITTNGDTIRGEVWEFTTKIASASGKATNPTPADSSAVKGAVMLKWQFDAVAADSFYVYIGASANDLLLVSKQKLAYYIPKKLVYGNTYFWRIDTKNKYGTATGDVWKFSYTTTTAIPQPDALHEVKLTWTPGLSGKLNVNCEIPQPGEVTLKLYDITGKFLRILYSGMQQCGKQTVELPFYNPCLQICKLEYRGISKSILIMQSGL